MSQSMHVRIGHDYMEFSNIVLYIKVILKTFLAITSIEKVVRTYFSLVELLIITYLYVISCDIGVTYCHRMST